MTQTPDTASPRRSLVWAHRFRGFYLWMLGESTNPTPIRIPPLLPKGRLTSFGVGFSFSGFQNLLKQRHKLGTKYSTYEPVGAILIQTTRVTLRGWEDVHNCGWALVSCIVWVSDTLFASHLPFPLCDWPASLPVTRSFPPSASGFCPALLLADPFLCSLSWHWIGSHYDGVSPASSEP